MAVRYSSKSDIPLQIADFIVRFVWFAHFVHVGRKLKVLLVYYSQKVLLVYNTSRACTNVPLFSPKSGGFQGEKEQ